VPTVRVQNITWGLANELTEAAAFGRMGRIGVGEYLALSPRAAGAAAGSGLVGALRNTTPDRRTEHHDEER